MAISGFAIAAGAIAIESGTGVDWMAGMGKFTVLGSVLSGEIRA